MPPYEPLCLTPPPTHTHVPTVSRCVCRPQLPPMPESYTSPYFSLPFTGRQLGSYGGYLRYSLRPATSSGRREPTVIIGVGNG